MSPDGLIYLLLSLPVKQPDYPLPRKLQEIKLAETVKSAWILLAELLAHCT